MGKKKEFFAPEINILLDSGVPDPDFGSSEYDEGQSPIVTYPQNQN